jgi:hypothetical protein
MTTTTKTAPATPGNTFGRKLATLRAVMVDAVAEDDLRAIMAKLVEQAKAGDMAAIREVLTRTVGRPGDERDPDRIVIESISLEADRFQALRCRRVQRASPMEELADAFGD